jgi:hypothetical protein
LQGRVVGTADKRGGIHNRHVTDRETAFAG